ncbi:MAG TPA: hypothetical protein VFZ12_02425, partial [Dehalococcoidia bacterium]|nr:hypothetical protein [Dehalococcoidia bacterium]
APHPRAAEVSDVVAAFAYLQLPVYQAADVEGAVELGRELSGDHGWLVIAGSFAVAARAREVLLGLTPALPR